jgi:hypothetical protein
MWYLNGKRVAAFLEELKIVPLNLETFGPCVEEM